MQICLGDQNHFWHLGGRTKADAHLDSLLPWLTEQYDRAERKETWLITMEVTITVLVAAELIIPFLHLSCR